MSNRAMEFHDSRFDGVEKEGTNLALRFSAAYIHESEGEPGVDAGSGWVQELRLVISDALQTGEIVDVPCDLCDGSVWLDDQRLENVIPIPLDYRGCVELRLEQTNVLTITGKSLRVELCGEPKYVEEFPGSGSISDNA
jgi:hypothetical protein